MRYYVPYKPGDEFKHRTPEGMHSFKMDLPYFASMKTNFNKTFAERQRELKRIGNMIDDIIASKCSRTVEKSLQKVRLHINVIHSFLSHATSKNENDVHLNL